VNLEQRPPISRRSLLGLGALLFAVSTAQTWWVGRNDTRLGGRVAALAGPGDIRMLSSETCAVCLRARQWLVQHRVPFEECLIEQDAVCRQTLTATGLTGTPVFLVRGRPQLGFSPQALERALQPGPPPAP